MMRRWLVILLVLLFIPVSQPVLSGSNGSDAPYIQYYSDYLNAFVIERADGTDSRVLGEGLFPPDTWSVSSYDMRWSPSGEWLAFDMRLTRMGRRTEPIYMLALNVDGQRTLTSIDQISNPISDYYWISERDFLVVVSEERLTWDVDRDVEVRQRNYYLIDASADEIINQLEVEMDFPLSESDSSFYSRHVITTWLEAASQLTFVYVDPLSRKLWVKMLDKDGVVSSRYFQMPESQVFNFHLFPDGRLLIPDVDEATGYILIDLLEDTTQMLALQALYQIYTSSDAKKAVLVDAIPENDRNPSQWSSGSFYLLDVDDTSTIFLGDFPLQTDVYWSNDGNFIIFDQTPLINIYDVQQDSFNLRPLYFDSRIQLGFPIQFRDNEQSDELAILNYENRDDHWQDILYIYDLATGNVEEHPNLPVYGYLSSISPNLNFYLDYTYENIKMPLIIRSLDDNSQVEFPLSERNRGLDLAALLDWHTDGHWFLIHEAVRSNGGTFTQWSGIANMDGLKRNLSYCVSCAIWLPERIEVDKLPEGQAASVLPVVTPPIEVVGSDEILWHEDYVSVDDVVYDINSGDIISLPDYDISFEASNDVELSFDDFPYRIVEITDGISLIAMIEQSTEEILQRFYVQPSYTGKGKLMKSRGIYIQPTAPTDGLLVIWDLEHGEIIASLPIPALEVFISPDEEHVALQMEHETVQVWSVDELLELGLVVPPREVPLDYEFDFEQ